MTSLELLISSSQNLHPKTSPSSPHIQEFEEIDFGTGMAFHKHYLSSERLKTSVKNSSDEKVNFFLLKVFFITQKKRDVTSHLRIGYTSIRLQVLAPLLADEFGTSRRGVGSLPDSCISFTSNRVYEGFTTFTGEDPTGALRNACKDRGFILGDT
jgi:hypothetical protein